MLTLINQGYSAILVTYNAEKNLNKAIESILNQEIAPSEIIVVDDCSGDGTVERVQQLLVGFDAKIITTNVTNLGQAHSRNVGATLASFEYLIFFDDDDFSNPSRSTLHLQQLENSDLSYVSSIKIYPSGYQVKCTNNDYSLAPTLFSDLICYLLLGKKIGGADLFVPTATLGCRRSAIFEIGGFDINFRRQEDVEFAIRAAVQRLRISWTPIEGVKRFHTVNASKGHGIDSSYELLLISKVESLMTDSDANQARFLSYSRKAYFSGKYFELIFQILAHPRFWWFALNRLPALCRRLIHEARM